MSSPSSWAADRARDCFRSHANAPSRPCRSPANIASSTFRFPTASIPACKRIYLLTQFNSASLHRHISQSYKFDHFSGGFVEILAAEQTFSDTSLVPRHRRRRSQKPRSLPQPRFRLPAHPERRPTLSHGFSRDHRPAHRKRRRPDHRHHPGRRAKRAGASASCRSTTNARSRASWKNRKTRPCRTALKMAREPLRSLRHHAKTKNSSSPPWAFTFSTATSCCSCSTIPSPISASTSSPARSTRTRFIAYVFQGYWEDIGTIRSFFEANLDLVTRVAALQFLRHERAHFHAPALSAGVENQRRGNRSRRSFPTAASSIIARSTTASSASAASSAKGCDLNRAILLGCDYYESAVVAFKQYESARPAAHWHRTQHAHRKRHHR